MLFTAGSWGGGPTGGYPSIGLDSLSNPGYNAGMVSLALKKKKRKEIPPLTCTQKICNVFVMQHQMIALNIPVRMNYTAVHGISGRFSLR